MIIYACAVWSESAYFRMLGTFSLDPNNFIPSVSLGSVLNLGFYDFEIYCIFITSLWSCNIRISKLLSSWLFITKTRLYKFDPLKPHFYIVKLGFTEVYIIFLILLKNIDCGCSLEPPHLIEAVLTSTHNLCFEQKYGKYQNFLFENVPFLVVKFSIYLNRRVFIIWSY